MIEPSYIGRFAPTPSGALHLGSLFAALASFLDARAHQGLWLLRIDDLDTPRIVKGAVDDILNTLAAFELHWDKEVVFQSNHQSAYREALHVLQQQKRLYRCICTRKNLGDVNLLSTPPAYPNICRNKNIEFSEPGALRVKTEAMERGFVDILQGRLTENLALQQGDFIVQRRDHIIAYQLAVVIDDHLQGITRVVRGADLLDSTLKQCYLQQCLNLSTHQYMHVPVLTGEQGAKLSKSEASTAVSKSNIQQTLFSLLVLLQQNPPEDLKHQTVSAQLGWAIAHWHPEALSGIRSISLI